jgi:hypothetical protein
MTKSFYVCGYAVNKRGNTVGIHYDVQTIDEQQAIIQAEKQAQDDGFRYICLTRVILREVRHA